MGCNCSRKDSSSAGSMETKSSGRGNDQQYSPLDLKVSIVKLERLFFTNAALTWVLLPLFGVIQALVPPLQPTCEHGYANVALVFVAAYEAYHIYSERNGWYGTMKLLADPEVTIMRHLGVLKQRRFYFVLGIVESLDLYAVSVFPFIARACDAHLTSRWQLSWKTVPVVGSIMVSLLEVVRFWGFCLIIVVINVTISGFYGIFRMHLRSKEWKDVEEERIGGEHFFRYAQSAETAMLPSVAMLSEEIAQQRKYKYDSDKAGDAKAAMEARVNLVYGKTTKSEAFEKELADRETEEKVKKAAWQHYVLVMVVKVLIGNVAQLSLMASFYAVTFEETGTEARVKVAVGMVCGAIQALLRCKMIIPRLGGVGALLSLIAICVVGWSAAKVYFAYKCESHMWGISTGCIEEEAVESILGVAQNTTNVVINATQAATNVIRNATQSL